MSSRSTSEESSLLEKLDSAVPAPLAQFDAFPKLPLAYKSRSESRGLMTIAVALLALLLMLNDIGEYVWGWRDEEFSIDNSGYSFLDINVDVVVAMPCGYLSVDIRDALGDRLMLRSGLVMDGTVFDTSHAKAFQAHSAALSVQQAVSQSRKSRGLFAIFSRRRSQFRPTYKHNSAGDACRIYGTLTVKKVTANLHITTQGHGYASQQHVDHSRMNLSHVISEFSFGPYFPDITQPLDYSFEVANEPFVAYQYFLHVVPTTYIAPRSAPLHTNQYSVTHYKRTVDHDSGTPGIFFKFDLDPLHITVHQRTTSLVQLFIRCVGVLGGIFVCTGYAIRITTRAVEAVSGADSTQGIVAAEATGVRVPGLRAKWGGGSLRSRNTKPAGRLVPQGTGWVLEGTHTPPYTSASSPPFTTSPLPPSTSAATWSGSLPSPYLASPAPPPPRPITPTHRPHQPPPTTPSQHGSAYVPGTPDVPSGMQISSGAGNLHPSWSPLPRTPQNEGLAASGGTPGPPTPSSLPGTPSSSYVMIPPSPSPHRPGNGHDFAMGQLPPGRRAARTVASMDEIREGGMRKEE